MREVWVRGRFQNSQEKVKGNDMQIFLERRSVKAGRRAFLSSFLARNVFLLSLFYILLVIFRTNRNSMFLNVRLTQNVLLSKC